MAAELEESLIPSVEKLLDLKMNAPEIKEIPRADEINSYLDRTIEELKVEIAAFPAEHRADWDPLNQLFLETLAYHTKPLSDSERIDITADMILRRYKEAFMELAK